jgi:hypothetical protein
MPLETQQPPEEIPPPPPRVLFLSLRRKPRKKRFLHLLRVLFPLLRRSRLSRRKPSKRR